MYLYNAFLIPLPIQFNKIIVVIVILRRSIKMILLCTLECMHARRNTSEYIRWHFAVRSATRPIQSRPNRKMSRNVGNWKAYSYFFRYTRNARYRESRPYFHFACLTRGAQPSACLSAPWGMRKGGEYRKGSFRDGLEEGEPERRIARRRIALVNASGGWCRWESNPPFMRFISGKQPSRVYIIIYIYVREYTHISHNELFQFLRPPTLWYAIEMSNGYLSRLRMNANWQRYFSD